MPDTIVQFEPLLRVGCFVGTFAVMAAWELSSPRRASPMPRLARWPGNVAIAVLNTLLVRVLAPSAAVGVAVLADVGQWGLLHQLAVAEWLAVVISVVFLDFVIYLQHVLFHAVPALWRVHRTHHTDTHFDVSTGVRFHPIEILLSLGLKLAVVVALGAPAIAVLIFEILLNATSLFNHGNVRMPSRVDSVLRWFVVTPDMHRVHHSVVPLETNSNFGFNLPWWDRLLGTYRGQPLAGHRDMVIGIEGFHPAGTRRLAQLLVQPFVGTVGNYSIAPRDDHKP